MAFYNSQKVGLIRIVMAREDISQKKLFFKMCEQCQAIGIKPVTRTELSKLSYGDVPDRQISTYVRILNALNALRRRKKPYTIDEIIEPDEILRPRNKK